MWYTKLIETVSELHFPPTDVYETEKELIIVSEVPGMSLKDLTIETKENILTLSGTKKSSREEVNNNQQVEQRSYHLSERLEKSFRRTFYLEEKLNPNSVDATFKDGLLTIKIQKRKLDVQKVEIKEVP